MIDSHHHLWRYSAEEYPWIPPGSPLAGDHGIAELELSAAAAGLDRTVVVQARQSLAESDWLLEQAANCGRIAGVIGWVPLVEESVDHSLQRFAAHSAFKGVRHVLQDEPDDYFLRNDFHRGLACLPALGLRYDLLILQRQLPVAIQLVDRQPDLGFVIDHLAKPVIHRGKIDPTWRSGMIELAKRDHVLGVKVSGMVTEVMDSEIDEATLRAYFDETLAIFGVDRLLFGSDWPVCLLRDTTCRSWKETVAGFADCLSDPERNAVFHDNAVRIYGL